MRFTLAYRSDEKLIPHIRNVLDPAAAKDRGRLAPALGVPRPTGYFRTGSHHFSLVLRDILCLSKPSVRITKNALSRTLSV